MTVTAIWAEARRGVIGIGGTIPWQLPEDQQHFRQRTMGATVVMGRSTWDSLPRNARPLAGRRNIVLTRDRSWTAPGAEPVHSVDQALTLGPLWVIGGEIALKAFLPHTTMIVRTRVDLHARGDVYAPTANGWIVTTSSGWQASRTGLLYVIEELHRTQPERTAS